MGMKIFILYLKKSFKYAYLFIIFLLKNFIISNITFVQFIFVLITPARSMWVVLLSSETILNAFPQ